MDPVAATGKILPTTVFSTLSDLIIVFTSDYNLAEKGFKAEISFFPSGTNQYQKIKILFVLIIFILTPIGESCRVDDFPCANQKCIPLSKMCNGKDDCGDNSDETTVCSGMLYHLLMLLKLQIYQNNVIFEISKRS